MRTYSARDLEILYYAQLQADAPAAMLAKQSGHQVHTVRHVLNRFQDNQVSAPFPFINVYPLGFDQYGIFFSLAGSARTRTQVLAALAASDRIAWILELAGDFQYGIALYARRGYEVVAFLEELSSRFGQIFFEKSLAVRCGWTLFPRRYLSRKKNPVPSMRCGNTGTLATIDQTDHSILRGLSSVEYSSYRDLALTLKMPHTTLQHRIQSLRERSVLSGFALGIDPNRLGMHPYRLLVYATKMSATLRSSLYKFCSQHLYVFALIECVGSWDFELKVEVPSPGYLTEITNALYDEFGQDISTIKTLAVLKTIKLAFYPFEKLGRVNGELGKQGFLDTSSGVRPAWD